MSMAKNKDLPIDLHFVKKEALDKFPLVTDLTIEEMSCYDYIVRGEGSLFSGYFERTIYPISRTMGSIIYIERFGEEQVVLPTNEWYMAKEEDLNDETLEEPPHNFYYHEKKRRGLL